MSNLLEFHQAVVRGDLPEVQRLSLLVDDIDDVLGGEQDDEMKIGDEKFIDYHTLTSSGTALMKAACYGHIDIVNYLLANAASVQEANDDDDSRAIEYAATIGRADIVYAILRACAATADAEEISHQKMCAFGLAIRGGKNDVIRLLLSNGIEVDQPREDGATALILAAEFGQKETVQCLLEEYGANMEARDAGGYTALLAAAETKSSSTLQLLVNSGADIQAVNQKGEKAIECAARRGNVDSTMILLFKHAMSAPETLAEAWRLALTSAVDGGSCDVIYEMFKNKNHLIEETGIGKAETAKAISLATRESLGSCFVKLDMRPTEHRNAKEIAFSLLTLKASKEEFDGMLKDIDPIFSILAGSGFGNKRDEIVQLRKKAGQFSFEISGIFDEENLKKILYDFYEDLGVPSNSPQGSSSSAAASAPDRGRE